MPEEKPEIHVGSSASGPTASSATATAEVKPAPAINLLPGDEHPLLNKLVEIDYDICIGCVLCSEICPWETIVRIPYDDALALAPKVTLRRYQDLPPENRIEGKKW
jgi:NAD-dependent dihydropyrimidine dehydrogenase PreA subunit